MNRWGLFQGSVGISLDMCFFTFYHGKSPFFNTIWDNILIDFQPPNEQIYGARYT